MSTSASKRQREWTKVRYLSAIIFSTILVVLILTPAKHLNDTAIRQIRQTLPPRTPTERPQTATPSATINPTDIEELKKEFGIASDSGALIILPKDLKK